MENRVMPRGALFLCLMTTACAAGGATGGAPIAYGPSGYARPAQPPPHAEYSDATPSAPPAYAPPQTPSPAAPQQQPEETALSAYALQPDYGDPRHPPRTHTVGRNESLYDIAVHYQIPMQSLIAQNGLQPPYALAPGRVIELPPPRIHVVAEGETFEDVARIESIDRRSLALLNRMSEPYVVHPGDQLVLPALPGAWSDSGAPPPQTLQPTPAYIPPPPTPPRSTPNGRFTWPVRGVLAASFGPQGDGRRLDGIEILAPEGAPISAAEEGDVVYAGSDVPGYGALVLVRHADGYVTAYGYARRAVVREGQHVRAGQTLAEVGRGRDGRAMLLFQVRQGAHAVDPAPLLNSR